MTEANQGQYCQIQYISHLINLLSEMFITVSLFSEKIDKSCICSHLQFHASMLYEI